MKKIILILIVAMSFTACKKENNYAVSIIGKWRLETSNSVFYTFNSDKTYSIVDTRTGAGVHLTDIYGNYKVEKNTIYYYSYSNQTAYITEKIQSIKDNILILGNGNGARFIRVN